MSRGAFIRWPFAAMHRGFLTYLHLGCYILRKRRTACGRLARNETPKSKNGKYKCRCVTDAMENIEKYQKQLLEQTRSLYRDTPISEATEEAYLATPRHRFVGRYREWGTKEWNVAEPDSLAEHIATLYADRPLILFGDDDQNIPSTVSQPSLVLRMLDLLQLKAGHRVFELGAGSGWNAALIGRLVGPEGQVVSLEIIPELARSAQQNILSLGITNVHIIAGDGAEGYGDSAPYDRAIFTAGSFDVPHYFYEQLREEGLLLVVFKTGGGGDNLFLLRKMGEHFESLWSGPCGFVQLRGVYQFKDLEPNTLEEAIPGWSELQNKEIDKRHFWWGSEGTEGLLWNTLGIRSFLVSRSPHSERSKRQNSTTIPARIVTSGYGTPQTARWSSRKKIGYSPMETPKHKSVCCNGFTTG
jgi:protein-L-isoaspartate(D-aspartate) O-methyltransferase